MSTSVVGNELAVGSSVSCVLVESRNVDHKGMKGVKRGNDCLKIPGDGLSEGRTLL